MNGGPWDFNLQLCTDIVGKRLQWTSTAIRYAGTDDIFGVDFAWPIDHTMSLPMFSQWFDAKPINKSLLHSVWFQFDAMLARFPAHAKKEQIPRTAEMVSTTNIGC